MDYRKILIAYMMRVIDCETYDYTYEAIGRRANFPTLTSDETAELLACCQEAWEDRESPSKDLDDAIQGIPIPDTPFLLAVNKSPSFKEGQIVTCDGLKPMLVTIAKNGKVALIPKDE